MLTLDCRMSIRLVQQPECRLALECPICKRFRSESNAAIDQAVALVAGETDPYAICLGCGQRPVNKADAMYRRRQGKRLRLLRAKADYKAAQQKGSTQDPTP